MVPNRIREIAICFTITELLIGIVYLVGAILPFWFLLYNQPLLVLHTLSHVDLGRSLDVVQAGKASIGGFGQTSVLIVGPFQPPLTLHKITGTESTLSGATAIAQLLFQATVHLMLLSSSVFLKLSPTRP